MLYSPHVHHQATTSQQSLHSQYLHHKSTSSQTQLHSPHIPKPSQGREAPTRIHPVDDRDSFWVDTQVDRTSSGYLSARSAMLLRWDRHPTQDTFRDDFAPPCPWMARHCPCLPCCCCLVVPRAARHQFALTVLHSRVYPIIYLLIIGITVTLLLYALYVTSLGVLKKITYEPWIIIADTSCVGLIIFDVIVQIQSRKNGYWKSSMNIFDSVVVLLCLSYLPIYFYQIEHGVLLNILLSIRFMSSFLAIVMVYKHQMDRTTVLDVADKSIVDFTNSEHLAYDATSVDDVTFGTHMRSHMRK